MRLFIFMAMAAGLSAPAMAQQSLFGQQMLLDKAEACALIDDAGQRHACFDGLVPDLRKSGVDRFGAPPPKAVSKLTAPVAAPDAPRPSAAAPTPAPAEKISLTVKTIGSGSDGKLRFIMENGQVWRQLDIEKLKNLGQGPWTAEIRTAAMGSFLLSINGGRAVRVQRVN